MGVYVFTYIHTEFKCVFIYLRVCTQSFHVGVYIFTCMYTEFTCVCVCVTYMHAEFICGCEYIYVYVHRV